MTQSVEIAELRAALERIAEEASNGSAAFFFEHIRRARIGADGEWQLERRMIAVTKTEARYFRGPFKKRTSLRQRALHIAKLRARTHPVTWERP